jgi:hypothetical protein
MALRLSRSAIAPTPDRLNPHLGGCSLHGATPQAHELGRLRHGMYGIMPFGMNSVPTPGATSCANREAGLSSTVKGHRGAHEPHNFRVDGSNGAGADPLLTRITPLRSGFDGDVYPHTGRPVAWLVTPDDHLVIGVEGHFYLAGRPRRERNRRDTLIVVAVACFVMASFI